MRKEQYIAKRIVCWYYEVAQIVDGDCVIYTETHYHESYDYAGIGDIKNIYSAYEEFKKWG